MEIGTAMQMRAGAYFPTLNVECAHLKQRRYNRRYTDQRQQKQP